MGTRRKSRELCLQMLFQWDMGKQPPEHVKKTFWSERGEVDEETRNFADDIFQVAVDRQQEIEDVGKQEKGEDSRAESPPLLRSRMAQKFTPSDSQTWRGLP